MANPLDKSLPELAAALRARQTTAKELTEACVANRDATDDLNAYKKWKPDFARQSAALADDAFKAGVDLGALQGIPVSVKDLYGVQGIKTFAGTHEALPEYWQTEGPVVKSIRQQLAVVTGKTHTVELAFGGLGVNSHWDTPRNPWDADNHRVPGGSSAGAGVSLQQGSALVALGTDTAGSVRIPASMTGTVGLKTSVERWSTTGIVPLSTTLDTAGVLARTVEDVAYAFAAIDPFIDSTSEEFLSEIQSYPVSAITIGIIREKVWDDCSAGVAEAVQDTLKECEQAGVTLKNIALPECTDAIDMLAKGSVAAAECDEFIESVLPEWRDHLDPLVSTRIRDGDQLSAREYLTRLRWFDDMAIKATTRFNDCDVMALPTVCITPPRLDEVSELDGYRANNMLALRNTCIANFFGLCAITIPAGLDQTGMPVSLQLMARHGDEEHILAIALAVENIIGTSRQRLGKPPMVAWNK